MAEKRCFKCGEEKPLAHFYKHPRMKDGHLNKCKVCARNDSTRHRWANIDRIRAYDRSRGARGSTHRTKAQTAAHNAVTRAVARGDIERKETCQSCGEKARTVGHHDDYKRKLEVRWLCDPCHKQWHRDNGPGKNRD